MRKKVSLIFLLVIIAYSLSEAGNRRIVIFKQGVSKDAKERTILNAGCNIIKHLRLVNGMAVLLPATASDKAVEAISKNLDVVRIDVDLKIQAVRVSISPRRRSSGIKKGRVNVTKPSSPVDQRKPTKPDKPKPPKPDPEPDPFQTLPWGINRIDADLASLTGLGIKVAVMDTGIDLDHPDLAIEDDVNMINSRKSGDDDNGHGTHCAGIIAAVNNDIGVVGVAPQASLYAVKVLDRRGSGYLSDLVDGLDWCIDNGGIQVISMSLSAALGNKTFHEAIIKVHAAGIVQVAAAGNDAGTVKYPAAYSETIAVSATDSSDKLASFSNYGKEIDLAAPGVAILSTYKGGDYKSLSGTSMSCPHVAGAVALELQQNLISPDAVKEELKDNAEFLSGLTADQQGAGLVDAEKILTK